PPLPSHPQFKDLVLLVDLVPVHAVAGPLQDSCEFVVRGQSLNLPQIPILRMSVNLAVLRIPAQCPFSPYGSRVVFGNIPSVDDVTHPLRLFLLDVSAKTIEAIPGSEGLYSPSWSGNGEYIAALDSKSNRLMLYTVASGKWFRLTKEPAGYPAWANDSTAIYFAHR